jgi:hypothetical protein
VPTPSPGLDVDAVTSVEHGGRPAWEAYVRTTPAYEPRCGCCPLLRSPQVDEREYGSAHGPYPEVQRVRLDVQTGVCVLADDPEALGTGHDLRIEAVDEPMPDDLFPRVRHGRAPAEDPRTPADHLERRRRRQERRRR